MPPMIRQSVSPEREGLVELTVGPRSRIRRVGCDMCKVPKVTASFLGQVSLAESWRHLAGDVLERSRSATTTIWDKLIRQAIDDFREDFLESLHAPFGSVPPGFDTCLFDDVRKHNSSKDRRQEHSDHRKRHTETKNKTCCTMTLFVVLICMHRTGEDRTMLCGRS